jgi:hypothetical protein
MYEVGDIQKALAQVRAESSTFDRGRGYGMKKMERGWKEGYKVQRTPVRFLTEIRENRAIAREGGLRASLRGECHSTVADQK